MNRSTKKMLGRVVCAGALIVLFGVWSWKAGKEVLSVFYLESAWHGLQRSAALTPPLQARELERVMQHLTDSLHHSPRNPWALEEMGALQLRRMRAPKESRIPFQEAVRGANANYHLALLQRPTAPLAWANLAMTNLYLSGQDEEFIKALRYADELAPWDPEVQQLVLFISFVTWDKLGTAQRDATVRTLERAAQKDAQKVTSLVESFKRLDLLCGIKNAKLMKLKEVEEACSRFRKSTGEKSSQAR